MTTRNNTYAGNRQLAEILRATADQFGAKQALPQAAVSEQADMVPFELEKPSLLELEMPDGRKLREWTGEELMILGELMKSISGFTDRLNMALNAAKEAA